MKEEQFNEFLQDEDKKVDYKTIIFEYLLYWPVILAFLVVTLAGAYVYLRYQAPVYSVSSTVLLPANWYIRMQKLNFAVTANSV